MAGGPLSDADQEAVNLAAKLVDGEQIYMPHKGAAGAGVGISRWSAPASARPDGATAPAPVRFPVHLNTAAASDLDAVPGIGPAMADRIIAYRQANGPFQQLDDLLNVSGIGQKTLDKLRAYLAVP